MAQVNCRIDAELYERLRDYQEKTGVPISRCIDDAVKDWLESVAPLRLEALTVKPSKAPKPRK
jgi:predicted DNA-binding protein